MAKHRQLRIPEVNWDEVEGNYAVVRLIPRGTNSIGSPEIVPLPYPVSSSQQVVHVFSTHVTLKEAQDALLRLVRGDDA